MQETPHHSRDEELQVARAASDLSGADNTYRKTVPSDIAGRGGKKFWRGGSLTMCKGKNEFGEQRSGDYKGPNPQKA